MEPSKPSASRAAALSRAGRFDEALADLDALRRSADGPETAARIEQLRGAVLAAAGRTDLAEEALRHAVALDPGLAGAWADLAELLEGQGYAAGPVQAMSRALALAPHDLDLVLRAGRLLGRVGHVETARRCFDLVLRRGGRREAAIGALAELLERTGEPREAASLLAPLVDAGRLSPAMAITWARAQARLGAPEVGLVPVEHLLAGGLGARERALLRFEQAALLHRMKAWDPALDAALEANRLLGHRHDPEADAAEVARIRSTFSAEAMARLPRAEGRGRRSLLIVGTPRSGTTLVEQVLARHPEVHAAGEREELRLSALALRRELGEDWPVHVRADHLDTLARHYEARVGREAGEARVVTDKMPENLRHLGLAGLMLPEARVVMCVRDPLDTGLSCLFQPFGPGLGWSTRLDWIGHRLALDAEMRAHWQAVRPLPILVLRYEDLVDDPEREVRRLLAHCGLDWHPACLDSHLEMRFVRTASYAQVREPVHRRSVGRAVPYRHRLGPMLAPLERAAA